MAQAGLTTARARARTALCAALGPLILSGLLAFPAQAQQAEPQPAPDADTLPPRADDTAPQVFEATYFTRYNPLSAGDMVIRIPGFEINDGDDRRGFGATGGNVLINGERPSSKATISEQLKRIPATSVLRVEIISGGGSADASGQSRVANVILKPSAGLSSPTTYILAARQLEYSERIGWIVQLSKSLSLADNLELALDVQAPNIRGRTDGYEAVRSALGDLTEYRKQYNQSNQIGVQVAANLKWRAGAHDRVNLNALYYPTDNSTGIGSVYYAPDSTLLKQTYGRADYPTNYRGELGGDWEHAFSDTLRIKLIGLDATSVIDQNQRLDTYLAAGLSNTQVQTSHTETGESVGRAVLTWRATGAHTLEVGGEGAFNFRETSLGLTNQAPGGAPVPVVFAVADTRVEELRGEAFLTDIWTLSNRLSLTSEFTFEASRITQTGDAAKQREFTYPKLQVTASWKAGPGSDVRASLKRDIAQLDFAEFASSFNSIDATTIVGNPDLEPEKAWKAKLEWDRRFGKKGAFTLGLFHDDVQDVRDLVVIGANDAYGNIGDGTRNGVEFRGALPLDDFGLPRAELRLSGVYQQTRVTDPLTGETRAFSSGDNSTPAPRSGGSSNGGPPPLNVGNRDWGYVASFRQDMPALKSSVTLSFARNADRVEDKRLEHIDISRGDRVDLNWETTVIPGVTMRLGFGNITSPQEIRVRTFYTPDRSSGTVLRTERRTNGGGSEGTRSYTIQIAGQF
jgi:hypothetical protein